MMRKARVAICAAVLLAACGAPGTRAPVAPGTTAPAAGKPPAGAAVYNIDAAQSELRLLVYRAGPMARLGHNHVIVNRAVSGWVDMGGPAGARAVSLQVPVAAFVVDEVGARQAEGSDFSQAVPDDARAGTRHNMLSAALLDAERFPAITVSSIAVTPPSLSAHPDMPTGWTATLAVEVAGHRSELTVPFTLEVDTARLSASGSATLRQTDLGLTPFSVMLGALQVQDELTVKFKLVASRG